MNRKQSKMLRAMRATAAEEREWQAMTAEEKGRLRQAFEACPWMMSPSFKQTKAAAARI